MWAGSGVQRANGCQRKQSGAPSLQPRFPPKRDRAGAEAKGRSGAQQGTSHSSPGRRQSGPGGRGRGGDKIPVPLPQRLLPALLT